MSLAYKLDLLAALKEAGYSTYRIRKDKLLSESTLQKLRNKEPIAWENIATLCALLDCQPGDILEFSEDTDAQMEFRNAKKYAALYHKSADEPERRFYAFLTAFTLKFWCMGSGTGLENERAIERFPNLNDDKVWSNRWIIAGTKPHPHHNMLREFMSVNSYQDYLNFRDNRSAAEQKALSEHIASYATPEIIDYIEDVFSEGGE